MNLSKKKYGCNQHARDGEESANRSVKLICATECVFRPKRSQIVPILLPYVSVS